MRKVTVSFDVEVPDGVDNDQVLSVMGQLIDVGLADATSTVEDDEGDASETEPEPSRLHSVDYSKAHSPGVWQWTESRRLVATDELGHKKLVMSPSNDDATIEISEANRRLIAAAPKLLAALIDVMGWFDTGNLRQTMHEMGETHECHRVIRQARSAIAATIKVQQ